MIKSWPTTVGWTNMRKQPISPASNWETIDANFIAKILVSGIYLWWEAAPTLDILKMQPQHSLALGLSNKELSIQHMGLWKDNSLYW